MKFMNFWLRSLYASLAAYWFGLWLNSFAAGMFMLCALTGLFWSLPEDKTYTRT